MKNTSFKALILSAALILSGGLYAQSQLSDIYVFSENAFENAEKVTSIEIGDVSVAFAKAEGSTDPAYYNSGTALRLYMHNTMTFAAPDGTVINRIEFSLAGGSWTLSDVTPSVGDASFSYEEKTGNWSGDAQEVTFTLGDKIDGESTQLRIVSITVTYTPGEVAVARPVATPPAGFYTEAQSVALTCATEGAEIYYTLDGTEPDATKTRYTAAVSIDKNTTLKAVAVKGQDVSSVLTAEYTFPVVCENIAAFMSASLERGTKLLISGTVTVTYQNGSYLYVADNTGAALIYGSGLGSFTNGDTFIGLVGTVDIFNGAPQLKDPILPEKGTGSKIEPSVMKPEDVDKADMHRYILLRGVETAADLTLDSENRNGEILSGSTSLSLFNNYKLGLTLRAGVKYDMVAIVGYREKDGEATVQLYPISVTESTGSALRPVNAKSVEAYSSDGVLYVSASVGDRIEVYSLLGSQLYNATATDAVTAIGDLPQSIVIVRVGSAATKVVVR